ncbi:hypothetical protein NPIL_474051 [Nephila pilipes]|uniref:Uncharacterized protein n=1 Tax=Nephila pilipes TaxID=299642 RepID=A0A8X6TM32_NEPPI|nr:hypothetical protein NPIL_474051 [Nephila pilipes]
MFIKYYPVFEELEPLYLQQNKKVQNSMNPIERRVLSSLCVERWRHEPYVGPSLKGKATRFYASSFFCDHSASISSQIHYTSLQIHRASYFRECSEKKVAFAKT